MVLKKRSKQTSDDEPTDDLPDLLESTTYLRAAKTQLEGEVKELKAKEHRVRQDNCLTECAHRPPAAPQSPVLCQETIPISLWPRW